jgi:hypothetical protein
MPTILNAGGAANKQENTAPAAPTETVDKEKPTATMVERKQEEADAAYVDIRYMVIALASNYSLYRRVNDKELAERNEYIGSCIRSSNALCANKGELEAYFPNLIGVSPNDQNFVRRVKEYLNNFQVKVDKLGLRLNLTFHYNHFKDYLAFKKKEEAIETEFAQVKRGDAIALKRAIENRIVKLNALESTKWQYGSPENVADYLLYRHCLLYSDVAKDHSLINKEHIRFYFKDEQKENELKAKQRLELNNAKRNFVTLIANDKAFEDVYVQYCVLKNKAIIPALAEDDLVKQENLDYFSQKEPAKFNELYTDRSISVKSLIERLVAYGILIRHPHSQNIVSANGDFIGANMKEATAWFKNAENEATVAAYENQLKLV